MSGGVTSPPLRIAVLAHSTLPRGGVVHAMNLCEALTALGLKAVLHAPDARGDGFFRRPACEARPFRVAPAPANLPEMVERRIADYCDWLSRAENQDFDVYHAHDPLSGNALATLKRGAFARTVHHLDIFADPRLDAWQTRSIVEADRLMAVSEMWRGRLQTDFRRDADVVGNGVDLAKFLEAAEGAEALRARWRLGDGPVFLSIGGVEARKNTGAMLAAFARLSRERPDARYVIAGGASLLDHGAYQQEFAAALEVLGPAADAVVQVGPVADAEMPALYRLASALVFASLKEGFGLCVLEAMASGTPVVVSRIAPFVEYLSDKDALFSDPRDPASIAQAMRLALAPDVAARLSARGRAIAAQHSWRAVAERSLASYLRLAERSYA